MALSANSLQRSITRIFKSAMLLCLLLPLSPAVGAAANDLPLEGWVQTELLPYLGNRLGRHPRLQGEAFAVVVIKNNRMVAHMDALANSIRQKIVNHLETVENANLVRSNPVMSWPNRLSIMNLNCPAGRHVDVWVTIEVNHQELNDELRVVVRAFDLTTNDWIKGFRMVWSGRPTEHERQLLSRQVVDTEKRGTRALPYTPEQADLLAANLARDAGCPLRSTGRHSINVNVGVTAESPAFFQRTAMLLKRYLGQFDEVETDGGTTGPTIDVTLKTFELESGLYQVWADLRGQENTYLIEPAQPLYVSLKEVAEMDAKALPPPTLQENGGGNNLIKTFDLIAPANLQRCEARDPWQDGIRKLNSESRLPSGACFAVRVRANADARLYLLSQTEGGQLTQLLPNTCDALGIDTNLREAFDENTLHVPFFANGEPGIFRLNDKTGTEHLYAVAVMDEKAEADLQAQLRHARDLCTLRSGDRRTIAVSDFRKRLSKLVTRNMDNFEWQSREFQHVPQQTEAR